jgi:hypothetical protein
MIGTTVTQRNFETYNREGDSLIIENVEIQIQDQSGTWRTVHTTQNQPQQVLVNMKGIQSRYPDKRVRAIGRDGRVIDLL